MSTLTNFLMQELKFTPEDLDAFDIGYNYCVFYYEEGDVLSFLSAEVMQS
jgi:hypothetical protein